MEKVPINIDYFTPPLLDLLSKNFTVWFLTLVQHKEKVLPLGKKKHLAYSWWVVTLVSPRPQEASWSNRPNFSFSLILCEASQQMSPWTLHITVGRTMSSVFWLTVQRTVGSIRVEKFLQDILQKTDQKKKRNTPHERVGQFPYSPTLNTRKLAHYLCLAVEKKKSCFETHCCVAMWPVTMNNAPPHSKTKAESEREAETKMLSIRQEWQAGGRSSPAPYGWQTVSLLKFVFESIHDPPKKICHCFHLFRRIFIGKFLPTDLTTFFFFDLKKEPWLIVKV